MFLFIRSGRVPLDVSPEVGRTMPRIRPPSLLTINGFSIGILMSMIQCLVIICIISELGRVLLLLVPLLIRYCICWEDTCKAVPHHLLPSAQLFVNSTGPREFKVALGLYQWWSEDTQLHAEQYRLKVQGFADLATKFEEVTVSGNSEHFM